MVDAEFVKPWIQKAENDILSARYLAENMHPAPIEIIGFHCQQAAEKYLKAFLVSNDQEPPKTHDLIELVKLCSNYNGSLLSLSTKCEYLIPFATRTRYPGTSDLEDEDIGKSLSFAQEIIEMVKSKISL